MPHKVAASGRAPSYKQVAMAILKNDVSMKSLGFVPKRSKYYDLVVQSKDKQLKLRW